MRLMMIYSAHRRMRLRGITIGMLSIVALAMAFGIYAYPLLPSEIASHWGAHGIADGYSKKAAIFLIPALMLFLLLLWAALPEIDPLKGIGEFRSVYDAFFLALLLFFLYLFFLILAWNFGYRFHFGQFLTPALAFLFSCVGFLLPRAKRNWFVGIRTPWTLSSDTVWEKTHAFGALLFKASAAVLLLGILFPDYVVWLVLLPILASTIATVLYSYLEFSKENK